MLFLDSSSKGMPFGKNLPIITFALIYFGATNLCASKAKGRQF
jgi:hypothetical protein